MMKIEYKISHPGESGAGIHAFTDTVTVEVKSGDPGGEPGEFATHIGHSLREWFDGATVMVNTRPLLRITVQPLHIREHDALVSAFAMGALQDRVRYLRDQRMRATDSADPVGAEAYSRELQSLESAARAIIFATSNEEPA